MRFFRSKGLATSFAWQDVWQEEHDNAFTVAKMADVDLLRDVREAVEKAVADGETLAEFRRSLEPKLMDAGWWGKAEQVDPQSGETKLVQLGSPRRLQTIYRTNLQMAYSAGEWERIIDSAESAPYLMYSAIDDDVTRDKHKEWDGTILRWDDAWWAVHRPPNGWNCRCTVIQLTERQAHRLGVDIDRPAPQVSLREYINRRTGEIMMVPVGIDPGFAYNPGASRTEQLQQQLASKLQAYRNVQ